MTPLGLRSARGGPAISLAFSVRMAKPEMGRRCVIAAAAQSPPIMVNSCAGKMGLAAAEAVVRAGLELVPCTFTAAPVEEGDTIDVGGVAVDLVGLEQQQATIEKVKQDYPSLIMVDFTLPDAVNGNARWYIENGIPFVMGTTGGDRQQLLAEVSDSGLYAVIAPQMGKQIVAFQAMMQYMAENFPGAFSGYELEVVESHQKTKVDTSGTAKAIVSSFQGMGLDFDVDQIEKVRDAEQQMDRMEVPEAALDGHAFHTYSLKSADGSVTFQFQHNVCGRRIYAEGTVDAALFLAKQIQDGSEQRLFNMIDVLKGGAMR